MAYKRFPQRRKVDPVASEKRRVAGLRAKRVGETWEALFENSAWRARCKVIRIPNGCKWVGPNKIKPVQSPFDFCVIRGGRTVFLDTKTTLGKAWGYADNDANQIHWLSHCAAGGCRAGYIIEFRAINKIVFFSVEQLAGMQPRTSLKPEAGLQLLDDTGQLSLQALFNEQPKETPIAVPTAAGIRPPDDTCA